MRSPDRSPYTPQDVTIGVFARERDKLTAATVDNLREKTPEGPNLLYVHAAVPGRYDADITQALQRFGPYTILHSDSYLFPIQATNQLIATCETDILALVQNDVMVGEGWLEPVLDDLNSRDEVDYVTPEIMEAHEYPVRPETKVVYHFNPSRSQFDDVGQGQLRSDVKRVPIPLDELDFDINQPRVVKHLEEHAFFGRTDSFKKVAPFSEHINTREQIEMALRMHFSGQTILFDPRSSVTYIEIPLDQDEIENYLVRWDPVRGQLSNDFIQAEWNLADYKSSMHDIENRIRRARALLE